MERELSLIKHLIKQHDLNLEGLNVLCECASGAYSYTPAIIGMAGGVPFNVGRDTIYGTFIKNMEVVRNIMNIATPSTPLYFYKDHFPDDVIKRADIIPNIGFVRPINENMISLFKSTAVVPLMWETWEFRLGEVDVKFCSEREIPVAGTDESKRINMFGYNGFIAIKLMFEMGLECYNNKIVLIGTGHTAESMFELLNSSGVKVIWFSSSHKDARAVHYSQIHTIFNEPHLDAIIVAEHKNNIEIIGNGSVSLLNIHDIQKKFPTIKVGHICGNLDAVALKKSAIYSYPDNIYPFGYMSYQAFHLGPQPVFELNILGLKVGEIMAKSRLSGASVEEAIETAVVSDYGQDFEGGFRQFASRL